MPTCPRAHVPTCGILLLVAASPGTSLTDSVVQLIAAEGLCVDVAVDGTVKIGFNGEDWFGPGRPSSAPDVGSPSR